MTKYPRPERPQPYAGRTSQLIGSFGGSPQMRSTHSLRVEPRLKSSGIGDSAPRCTLDKNSLLRGQNSLFARINSLFRCAGNFRPNRRVVATTCGLWSGKTQDSGKFPVIFPVCREKGRSRTRTPLRRQPASGVSPDCITEKHSYARQ